MSDDTTRLTPDAALLATDEAHRASLVPVPPAQDLTTRTPPTLAGGVPAVVSSMKHALGQMGVVRSVRTLAAVNQHQGFDCPGCAWPDPAHRSAFEFCENGAKAVADEATRARVTPEFFANYSVAALAERSDYWLNKQGRITHPMVRQPGAAHYTPIAWDDAFALIGQTLRELDSPDEAIFYTSGRTSNEAAFLYQLFARAYGTNNLPDCSNMCHESSGAGMSETIGVGKGTVTLEDFDHADAILIFGQNPGTNHPRMLTTLQAASRRGCEIVVINPLQEAGLTRFKHPQEPVATLLGQGTPIASLTLRVRVGGDVALLQGLMKAIIEADALDRPFIEAHTTGFDALEAHVRATSWEAIVEGSGVPQDQLLAAAQVVIRHERIIACWAMGLTQHKHGVANIQQVINLLLMRGAIGKQGAGACPVRGHSNVQGDRTMGIWEKPPERLLNTLRDTFGFEPPRHHGHDVVAAIEAMRDGHARVFFAMGGNFLSATPDTEVTAQALASCDLTVHVSTKLNRAHLVTGKRALILPCLGRTERDLQGGEPQHVSVEDSMSMVHASRGSLPPASAHLLSEPRIIAQLAEATLAPNPKLDWLGWASDYDRIRDLIAQVIPGFEDYNARLSEPGGFVLPNGPRDSRTFNVPGERARFTTHELPELSLPDGQLRMMTIRSHDQYNTTIYGLDDRYRGVHNSRHVLLMNQADIDARALTAGQLVTLASHHDGKVRRAPGFVVVPYDIPRGDCATYFPEANALVPLERYAHKSRTPASKDVPITIEPMSTAQP